VVEDCSGSFDVGRGIFVGVGEAVKTRVTFDAAVCTHANRPKKISFKRGAPVRPVDLYAAAVGARFLWDDLHCFSSW